MSAVLMEGRLMPADDGSDKHERGESTSRSDAPRVNVGRIVGVVLGVALLLVAVGGLAFIVFGDDSGGTKRAGSDYTIVVPVGTGERIDAGEPVDLMPADLALGVNDTLVIQNEDVRTHIVGPFTVRAGETIRHQFTQAGTYTGVCTVHSSGEVVITVS